MNNKNNSSLRNIYKFVSARQKIIISTLRPVLKFILSFRRGGKKSDPTYITLILFVGYARKSRPE